MSVGEGEVPVEELLIQIWNDHPPGYKTVSLEELEPFIRAVAAWRGDEDDAWANFNAGVALTDDERDADRELSQLLMQTQDVIAGDWKASDEGYSDCQRALRRLKLPRMHDWEPMDFTEVFEAFDERLRQHGHACYGIPANGDYYVSVIVLDPDDFERVAHVAGLRLMRWSA